jgi:hypothetical protein
VAILARANGQSGSAILDHQVVIRWRHKYLSRPQRLPVGGGSTGKVPGTLEDTGQRARAAGRDMQDNADRGRQIGGQSCHNTLERFHTTGRGADHHQVSLVAEFFEDSGGFHRSGAYAHERRFTTGKRHASKRKARNHAGRAWSYGVD